MTSGEIRRAGARLAAAASQFVGCPFRLHGRSPDFGLDCVGLLFASLEAIGRQPKLPNGYTMRNSSFAPYAQFAERNGLARVEGPVFDGDVILTRPGPGQFHLLISAGSADVIHAHAGLRQVVRTPCPPADTIITHWRLIAD